MARELTEYHMNLQGRVQFPTGGRVRERKLNRCDSGTDSRVWMEEDVGDIPSIGFRCP